MAVVVLQASYGLQKKHQFDLQGRELPGITSGAIWSWSTPFYFP
jgi:hypothetical protein